MYSQLPMKIKGLIPHQPPMLLVDQLISFNENEAQTTTIFKPDSIFLNQDGLLDEAIFFEMMAQTFAVLAVTRKAARRQMAQSAGAGTPRQLPDPQIDKVDVGYLVRVKHLVIHGRAEVETPIETSIKVASMVGSFSALDGSVSQNGRILASGQVTVFISEGS